MPDREKVIKGLECCASMDGSACRECPYSSECVADEVTYQTGTAHLAADALALLKEQEAVVRCKDCKECYFASNRVPTEQSYVCGKHGTDVSPEWFCADGERES